VVLGGCGHKIHSDLDVPGGPCGTRTHDPLRVMNPGPVQGRSLMNDLCP